MKLFPILKHNQLEQLQGFLRKDSVFLEKWGFPIDAPHSLVRLEKLISHPKHMWILLGHSEEVLCGFSLLSFQGIPHAFAKMDLLIQPMDKKLFQNALEKLTYFGFHQMGLESIQIPLLETEEEKQSVLSALGWSLDATLKEEWIWKDRLINEYRFGKLKNSIESN